MLTMINFNDAVGKTILRVHEGGDSLTQVYTDGTFAFIMSKPDGCDNSYLHSPYSADGAVHEIGYMTARELGIMTQDECNALLADAAKVRESVKRAEFMRLKAEFDPTPPTDTI